MAIPYLVVRKTQENEISKAGGLNILLNIYRQLLESEKEYLVIIKNGEYSINHLFLLHIFEKISKSEDYYMRGLQIKINRVKDEGQGNESLLKKEEGKTLYEKDWSRFEHCEYYRNLHPDFDKYKSIYEKFDFMKPKHIWKPIYYEHFFGIKPSILSEYNIYRSKICMNYLESLVFTLKYYFEGIPSWNWYYRFRAPPTMSDLCVNLSKFVKNINDIKFNTSEPYKPFDQLMMILPQQMGHILPKEYEKLMKNELLQYYPIGYELDIYLGGKYIYSEPILPNINDNHILSETSKIKLTAEEKTRNVNNLEPYIRNCDKPTDNKPANNKTVNNKTTNNKSANNKPVNNKTVNNKTVKIKLKKT